MPCWRNAGGQSSVAQQDITKPHMKKKKMLTDCPASMRLNIGCMCTGLINVVDRLKLQQGLQVS